MEVVTNVALKLLAGLLRGACDSQLKRGKVLNVESFVEVALRVNRDDLVLVVEVVEFDDLGEFLSIEGLSSEAE